jgi:glycosyltransferase involved in cell wall biosynthesis
VRVILALPAYNEEEALPRVLDAFQKVASANGYEARAVVVDDGSRDRTAQIAEEWASRIPLKLVRHEVNRGLGETIDDALRHAAADADPGDVIVTMDADGTHPCDLIPQMVGHVASGADIAIASRYRAGSGTVGLSRARELMSQGARFLFQISVPIAGVRDYTCGFRAYRAGFLQRAFAHYGGRLATERGFASMAEILLRLRRFSPRVREVAMVLRYDLKGGASKMNVPRTVWKTLVLIAKHRFTGGFGFWLAVIALLAAMSTAQISSMRDETQTWDEGIHIAAGYSYWKTGDFRLNTDHPPLAKLLAALPLLPLGLKLPLDHPAWAAADQITFGLLFLYRNVVPGDAILFRVRLITVLVTLLLGLALALWVRREYGPAAAVFALFLFAFDPNFIAHGRYVTNDVLVTLLVFVSVLAWLRYLDSKRRIDLVVAGICVGLALVSKFSALFLLPLLAVLGTIEMGRPVGKNALRLAGALSLIVVISLAIIAAVYGPATFHGGMHPYLAGVRRLWLHQPPAHGAYLLGHTSDQGWWYYYPVVAAVKTPLAILLLAVLCLIPAIRWGGRRRAALILPPALYFAACLSSRIDLGIRYLLPVFPFLYALLAGIVFHEKFRRWRVPVVALAAGLLLFESVRAYPEYLAFFNTASGGPENGLRYLADSNIDWGQDVAKLKRYLDTTTRPGETICLCFFGNSPLTDYGIRYRPVPDTDEVARSGKPDCLAVVSATPLVGAYLGERAYAWLRAMKPTARIGYSMYVYDLRRPGGA